MRQVVRHDARRKHWATLLLVLWVASALPWCHAEGQPPKDDSGGSAASSQPAEPKDGKKARKKPRGRLPRYYGKVVTDKQREEVYGIQARYREQIDKLRAEIAKLLKQQEEEVSAVLTDAQRSEVAKLREEAAKKRKSRSVKTARSAPK